jgi:hypothetical protein
MIKYIDSSGKITHEEKDVTGLSEREITNLCSNIRRNNKRFDTTVSIHKFKFEEKDN